jgi:hypothetical protein
MSINFKDQLICNKWQLYQDKLFTSLMNEYDKDKNDLLIKRNQINDETREEYINMYLQFHAKHKFYDKDFNCTQYHCMKSSYQYHKLSDTYRKAANRQKQIDLKYDHFKNRKLTKDSLIKEHLWYNLKNQDSIIISGDYSIITNDDITKYHPIYPNSLKLNNIPVSYIEISLKNKDIIDMNCHLLYFCFDMSTYCDVIDCILIMTKMNNNYFSYLPLDIIKYILCLTSNIF